jgi:hypothetical protein
MAEQSDTHAKSGTDPQSQTPDYLPLKDFSLSNPWTRIHTQTLRQDIANYCKFLDHQVHDNFSEYDTVRQELIECINEMAKIDQMMGSIDAVIAPWNHVASGNTGARYQEMKHETSDRKKYSSEAQKERSRASIKARRALLKTKTQQHAESMGKTSDARDNSGASAAASADGSGQDEGVSDDAEGEDVEDDTAGN